jgi:transcriptional regulator with XRE-family HTH domain
MSLDMTPPRASSLSDRVAEEIRVVLARRRVRQSQLARELGVSEQWISVRLLGKQPIDLNDLARIAEALGVQVTDLIPRTDGNSPTLRYRTSHERSRKRQTARPPIPRTPVVGRPAHEPHQPNGRPQPDLSPQPLRRPAIRRRRAMA